ncbi:MAG TPA: bifunctional nuclease family protein [Bacteroidota bacterium]|nr:bifunctional nuclease family protein [Bacteroidota bacterium]
MEKIAVDILALSTSPNSGGAFALILRESNGNRRLPIIIGSAEAHSIAVEMEGIKPPRPLTHDLMKNIISSFGAELSDIVIDELRDGTFYAKLNIDNQMIDSRPSDAIALAVRCGVQIYVAASVMDEAAFVPDEDEDETTHRETSAAAPAKSAGAHQQQQSKGQRLEQLRQQLQEALERENYEKAAQLRDEIRKLELRD